MLEIIGGSLAMLLMSLTTILVCSAMVARLVDKTLGVILDVPHYRNMSIKVGDACGSMFSRSEGVFYTIAISGAAYLLISLLFLVFTKGGSVSILWDYDNNRDPIYKSFTDIILLPYHIGAWCSPILAPIGLWWCLTYGARALVRLSKRISKLKSALDKHVEDKGAHK